MLRRAPTPRREAVSGRRHGLSTAVKTYLLRHAQVLVYSLGQLWRTPVASLMTAAVIGIALALPTGLHVLLDNAQKLSGGWQGATQISLFLKHDTTDFQARKLINRLRKQAEIKAVRYISREQALEEFKALSGFGDALASLQENPLPAVLVIQPATAQQTSGSAEALLAKLKTHPEVDVAQLDMQWIKRLYAIMEIVRQGVVILAALLALAVLLVVGNTIRLAIQNRRDEILVIKLIGGTDAFIRRPFLYSGVWYGLLGGIIAVVLISSALLILSGPVERLTGLYQSQFELSFLGFGSILNLLMASTLLGLLGSWLAVGRHLREIEPT
ncbi:MAG: permease-like cell division protein FtsX [Gammaproteobacteria bacterium]